MTDADNADAVIATSPNEQVGITCPACGCRHFHVIYTRRAWGGLVVRRRQCRHCSRRITTWERAIGHPLNRS